MAGTLGTRFDDALAYAARLHRDQVRKGSEVPYVSHLLAVASLALEDGADEDAAVAALLHDAAEDQGGQARLVEIGERFGPAVESIVDACSDSLVQPKPPWRRRKAVFIGRLRDTPLPVAALRVLTADKLHNIRCILSDHRRLGDGVWERKQFKGGFGGTLWYFEQLHAALGAEPWESVNLGPLHDEIERLGSAFRPDESLLDRLRAALEDEDPAGWLAEGAGDGYAPDALELARLVGTRTAGGAVPDEEGVRSLAAELLDRWYGDGWRREAAEEIARRACSEPR